MIIASPQVHLIITCRTIFRHPNSRAVGGVWVGINVNGAAPTSILIRLGVFNRNRLLICRHYLGGNEAVWPPHGDLAGPCRATHSKI